ncbi:type I interferon 4 [Pelobates cultripes]|uniref:Type I interferon 4 n=1 Tax=Pelobates cultripes TaxID=61616 RepID=A0AAD1SN69_PELCU|nr:type I interferon 4 [Pelobates cultripes]
MKTLIVSWRILFFSSLVSVIYSQNCKWLRPQQEYLSKQILQTFNQMSSFGTSSGICSQSSTILPNIDDLYNFSQDEDAIIIASEVTKQTIGFYKKHNEKLKCNKKVWERLHELLNYQENQLNDCIPEGAENSQIKQRLSEYFNVLEQIVNEKDDSCVHMIVQLTIKKNLQLVAQLSFRMRSRLLQKSSQSDNVI